jgi:hypothetical protein
MEQLDGSRFDAFMCPWYSFTTTTDSLDAPKQGHIRAAVVDPLHKAWKDVF